MTREEVLKGLNEIAEYYEYRYRKDRTDRRGQDLFFMNTAAEAAVLIMEMTKEEDDGK